MNICADFFEGVCSVPVLTVVVDVGRQLHVYFYVVDSYSKLFALEMQGKA